MNHWQAVYVKPRTEKKVLERLQKHFTVFCPIKSEKRKWSDRVKVVDTPILPGYVFFQGDESDRLAILQDSQVIRSVFWNGKPAVIYDYEVKALRQLISEYSEFEMRPLRAGEKAKIVSGPLENQAGSITEVKGDKVRLRLDSLGVVLEARLENVKRL